MGPQGQCECLFLNKHEVQHLYRAKSVSWMFLDSIGPFALQVTSCNSFNQIKGKSFYRVFPNLFNLAQTSFAACLHSVSLSWHLKRGPNVFIPQLQRATFQRGSLVGRRSLGCCCGLEMDCKAVHQSRPAEHCI